MCENIREKVDAYVMKDFGGKTRSPICSRSMACKNSRRLEEMWTLMKSNLTTSRELSVRRINFSLSRFQ